MKEFIETGKIVNIHGLRGEVKIMPWSDDPDFICGFDILYCGKDKKIFEIESARVHKNMVLIKFKGIDTPESANFLRNNIVYIDRNDVELEEGEIGIFFLDGDAYVKKYHHSTSGIQLISLNSKYPPINVSSESTLKTFGKVVG